MSDTPLRKTPLYDCHVRAGARIVPFSGFAMPVQYTGIVDEHHAVRQSAGLFDVSHMGEFELRGPYAAHVVDYLITNDASKLRDGQALYTAACNDSGTIDDDLIVYRHSQERWLIVCNASNHAKMSAIVARAADNHCEFDDITEATALIALQGPRAFEILAGAVDAFAPVSALAPFSFCDARIGNVACTIARTGYTGEDGVEIFCASPDAESVWNTLMSAGAPLGLKPAGLGARDTLRLEARLSLYGNDIDETTNPIEAGLGWVVKLNKSSFVGKEALEAIKAAPLSRKMVGFEVTGRGVARHGYVLRDPATGAAIGTCTSGSPSPTLGKSIGLGYVSTAHSAIGSPLWVDCRGKNVEAVVVKTPFYKRS